MQSEPQRQRATAALAALSADDKMLKTFDSEDLVVYAVGMLMSDEDGTMSRADLETCLDNDELLAIVDALLTESGLTPRP